MNNALQRVFCIDDEEDILQVLQLSLETVGGLSVVCCSNPVEALGRIEAANPEVIMLDVMMPQMDGPATFAALRKLPGLSEVPIVFMTARAQPEDIESYLGLGAAGVIVKPFDPMTVSSEIETIWRESIDA
jgi:two-component system, OmpR family, response regulator